MQNQWIEIWQDRTKPERPWIVSRDDEDGSTTLAVFDTEDEAAEFAAAYARECAQ